MTIISAFRRRVVVARNLLNSLRSNRPRAQGRFIIVDPGLAGNHGHHANHCRYLLQAAKAQGISTRLFAHVRVSPALQSDLGAVPHFAVYTYSRADNDPICGWLSNFFSASEATRADFETLTDLTREDVVYVQGAQPPQLAAAIQWVTGLREDRAPSLIVELGTEPGVSVVKKSSGGETLVIPDPRIDARACLYRFAAQGLEQLRGRPFHIVTYDPAISSIFARLMEEPVGVLPFPIPATATPRTRKGSRPVTIATLGHQQTAKGYLFMPEVAERLLKQERDIKLLIHNSDPEQRFSGNSGALKLAQSKLRAAALADSRILLDDRDVEFDDWTRLVETTDLMLCPYDPGAYAARHSGLAATAIANGIPLVVPAGSTLSQWVDAFGGCGATFKNYDALSIAAAVRRVLKHFDRYAECAAAAALTWANTQGPVHFLDQVAKLHRDGDNEPAAANHQAALENTRTEFVAGA